MDAANLIGAMFPKQGLKVSEAQHPYLHSQITELQVYTLRSLRFEEHEIWTKGEIHAYLRRQARALNNMADTICPNRLTMPGEGYFNHYKGIPCLHEKIEE